jgi:predicted CoA-binding protein
MALIETEQEIGALLPSMRTVAFLGIKTADDNAPAYYVPQYAQRAGMKIVPVPVYFPDVTEILGEKVYRRLSDIPVPIDAVVVFRQPKDIPAHVDDILAAKLSVVWMQLGIRNEEVAAQLVAAGIDVVQDKCLKVELEDRGR